VGWISPQGTLDELLPLREQLLAGDLRSLYIAWLSAAPGVFIDEEDEEGLLEPPVPSGLGALGPALNTWANFLWVDANLLAAAARNSEPLARTGLDVKALADWAGKQPAEQRLEWLVRLLLDDGVDTRREILREFRRQRQAPAAEPKERRSLADLRRLAEGEEERRKAEEAAAKEAERRRKAEERSRYLDSLIARQEALWDEVQEQVATKKASGYERAVEILKDLQDLAEKRGHKPAFSARLRKLIGAHSSKRAFLERLQKAGVG
jgi:hypothetical protein